MDISPDACIVDANIFVDFAEVGLFAKLTEAGFALATTDLIANELAAPDNRELISIGVKIMSLDPARIARMVELTTAAKQLGVSVHGTIWICDRLVESGALTEEGAHLALKEMREKGRRLPGTS